MKRTTWIAFAALTCAATQAWAQLRVVSYNMLDKPASLTDSSVTGYVNSVFGGIAARNVNGIAKRPDVIFTAEQTLTSPANLATMLNNLFGVTSYTSVTPTSPQSQGTSDRIAFIYDSSSVTLSSPAVALAINSSYPRPTIRAGFRPIGYTGAESDLYVYGMHLKASTGVTNVQERANQTLATRADADTLPAGSNIIYAGDFNVYTSDEQGYRNLFAAGNGQAVDPLNASYLPNGNPITWNNNAAYASIHTQSTRLVTLPDSGATGGVDDRFDYQLMSRGLVDGNGISYVGPASPGSGSTHSYTALGNNGNSFNKAINDPTNTAESPAVLNALYNLSDHLPIVADYQLPAKMSVVTTAISTEVIQGATVTTNVSVTNSASVMSPFGADALDFTVVGTNTLGSAQVGTIRATQGASVKTLTVNTSTPGSKLVQANVTSTNQGVVGGTFSANAPILVHSPATPSLTDSTIQIDGTVDVGIVAIGTSVSGSFDVHNLAATSFTAGLDLDSASLAGSNAYTVQFVPQSNIAAGDGRSVGFTFSPTLSQVELATLSILTSDQNLPGAQARDTLTIHFTARGAIAGDADLNNIVDFSDLLILAQNYETTVAGWTFGDFNRDHFVNFDDLLAVAQNYEFTGLMTSSFDGDWQLARELVPEPTCLAALGAMSLLTRRRR